MIKLFDTKMMVILFVSTLSLAGMLYYFHGFHSVNRGFNLACSSKGVMSVNGYTLNYVSSYRFKNNGRGATALTGKIQDKDGAIKNIGLQIYFDYNFDSGLLMLKTINIVKQVENAASEDLIKKVFPSIYYRVNSMHTIAIFEMGSGYRFDFNTYPVMYCY
ncbi:TPA: hypothetical protein MBD98_004524 [Klebsiella aerogenes]|uniref:hypothetical protein n=1 Tax=Klebsiella aerogenes TaxID=548 RepID=UPI0014950CCF|nr:hypothetical protein [Klebsiella aerogenes]NPD52870.1 hypothetical protein [Klebsiella aerogenes]NPD79997.1 hypothetical protein [Klebsiella aerogenes]HBT2490141.1 hypothetical protein [Klebsiella aerogenes]HBT2500656.1 hypothetical protein [Klebsiella aerogenes]